jgi:hypothetical protein
MKRSSGWIVVSLALLSGCASSVLHSETDGPVYPSVTALTTEADLVVRGVVGELRGTELDDGGDSENSGIEVAFYDFEASQVISGNETSTTIALGWIDQTQIDDGRSTLDYGDELMLFLKHRTQSEAPGIQSETQFYVVVGADNGVFDVDGNNVTARSPYVTTLGGSLKQGPAGLTDDELLTATVPDFIAAVEGADG